MKIVLIFVLVLSYAGGIAAAITFDSQTGIISLKELMIFLCVVVVNLLIARYLYLKASSKKTEWTLFGAIGNVNALLVFWLYTAISTHWREGKPFFRSE